MTIKCLFELSLIYDNIKNMRASQLEKYQTKLLSWVKIYWPIFFLPVIFVISFQYLWLTKFPIGHDAAHHISNAMDIEKMGIFSIDAFRTVIYPIPLNLFALIHKLTQIQYPELFIILICSFPFLTSLMVGFLSYKATNSKLIGILAAIFFASSRWVNDAMRIGFFAEAWGWFVFLVCSYFLIKRKLVYFFSISRNY